MAVEVGEVGGEAVELAVAEGGEVSGKDDGVRLGAGGEAVGAEPVDGVGGPVGGAVVALRTEGLADAINAFDDLHELQELHHVAIKCRRPSEFRKALEEYTHAKS